MALQIFRTMLFTHHANTQALNCDGGEANTRHLGDAYAAAEAFNEDSDTPFYLFISADFVHFSTKDPAPLSAFLKPWLSKPAQYKVDDKPFVSTFLGQGIDWETVSRSVGQELYVVPYYYASQEAADTRGISGLFSWYVPSRATKSRADGRSVWPGESVNGKVHENITTEMDEKYLGLLEKRDLAYMAPVSIFRMVHRIY